MVTNMVNWVIDNGPHVAIGRWLGPALLGQYTVANNLVKAPADHLVRNLQAVLFPLTARAQDNDAGIRRAYLTVLGGVALVSFPTFTFVALMSHPIVFLLLGSKWDAAAEVLAALSLAMVGHAVEALCGPILGGRGEPKVELRVKVVTLAMMLVVLAFTISSSVASVGWGVAFVYLFRWAWMNAAIMKRLHISVRALGTVLLGPFILAGVCVAIPAGLRASLGALSESIPPLWLFLLALGSTMVAITVLLLAIPHIVLGPYLLALLDRFIKQRPAIAHIPGLQRLAIFAARSAA
jgi:PST family polysaccharide transporter